MSKISILLSNYNGGQFIAETVRSVFEQSRRPDELIIVDDASTDDSLKVLNELIADAEFEVKLIRHESNMGQAAGFNTAYREATGDLICTLDADDLWKPNKLYEVEKVVSTSASFSIIQHQLLVVKDGKWTDDVVLPAMADGDLWKMWLQHAAFPHFVPTTGLVFSREVLDKVMPIPELLRISADSFLTRTSICHAPVISIKEPLGGYRIHSSNSVASNAEHDSWAFFCANVRPLLLAYYEANGFEKPHGYMLSEEKPQKGLLDVSPRMVMRRIRSMLSS